jgi:hypothetical protein
VDYFRAAGEADRIREQARARADALLTEATRVASVPWAAACAAVRRLRDPVGNNMQVAELCGLKPEEVRGMLAAIREGEQPPADAGETAGHAESRTARDELVVESASDEQSGRPQDDPSGTPSSNATPPLLWRTPCSAFSVGAQRPPWATRSPPLRKPPPGQALRIGTRYAAGHCS